MRQRTYHTGEFAARAAVTTRTLRYYDRIGLLPPAEVTEAGQRLYTDVELIKLQQILALKLLGFALAEIRVCLRAGPEDFIQALTAQRAMLMAKQRQLAAIIAAIDGLVQPTAANGADGHAGGRWNWETVAKLVEMMQVEQKNEWVQQYLTPEQQAAIAELSRTSYSEDAQKKLAAWGANWTEADQRRVDAQYAALAAGLKQAVADGSSPDSPTVQALAATFQELIGQFTHGDAEVVTGLANFWQQQAALPAEQQAPLPWGDEEQALLEAAVLVRG